MVSVLNSVPFMLGGMAFVVMVRRIVVFRLGRGVSGLNGNVIGLVSGPSGGNVWLSSRCSVVGLLVWVTLRVPLISLGMRGWTSLCSLC